MPVKNIIPGQKVTKEKQELARELRRNMTPAEKIVWKELRANNLRVHFRRQQVIQGFIVDFYCHKAGLVVEVDGDIHDLQLQELETNVKGQFRPHNLSAGLCFSAASRKSSLVCFVWRRIKLKSLCPMRRDSVTMSQPSRSIASAKVKAGETSRPAPFGARATRWFSNSLAGFGFGASELKGELCISAGQSVSESFPGARWPHFQSASFSNRTRVVGVLCAGDK